jgi:flagellar hook-associated protein 2
MTSSVSSTSSSTTTPSVSTGNAQDVSSLSAGSDGVSLAEAVTTKVQPMLDQASAVQTEINTNGSLIGAYTNMQSLLQSLQTAAANLTTEPLSGNNVFDFRSATLTSNSSTSASTLLSATVSANTAVGTHTVTVQQIATAESDASATQSVSSTTALNLSGTFTLGEQDKTQVSISVNSGMSLSQIASAINGNTSQTGVTATVVAVDSTHSTLVLQGQDDNDPISYGDSSGVLASLGVTATSTTGTATEATGDTALNTTGSFTINGGTDGSGNAVPVQITVGATDTLNTIAANINSTAQTDGSTVTATVVTNTDGTSSLKISSGGSGGVSFSDVSGSALSAMGITQSGAANQISAAKPALLTVDGVKNISRSTNQISDVLSGVTLNLLQADANTTVTVAVGADTTSVTNAVQAFVTAYNNWESFVTTNEATTSSGSASSSAVLFGDSTLRDASLKVDTMMTSLVDGNSLSGLGLTLTSSNQLDVDTTTLANQISSNFSGVEELFGSTLTSDNAQLQTYGSNYSTYSGTIQLTIGTDGDGNVNSVLLNGTDSSSFTFTGNVISGNEGTPYSGMTFVYNGQNGATVNVTSTQGIGSQLYQATQTLANTQSGTVQNLITSLQDQDTSLDTQYNSLINQANDYATFLTQQYGTMSGQINSAGETLSVLQALQAAQNSGNG